MGERSIVDILIADDEVHDCRSSLKADRARGHRASIEMMKRGVLRPPGGELHISLAHSDEDLDETMNVFEAAPRAAR